MAILTWSNQLELGEPTVDEQHQHLVEILNQLDEAVALGYEPQKVLKLADELIDYTHYHFEDEERFMLEGDYDSKSFAEHQAQHQAFVQKVNQERENAIKNPESVSNDLIDFLVKWLMDHILFSDKQMVLELTKKGSSNEEILRKEQTDIMQSNLYSALRESENRFKELADQLPALIWITNNKNVPIFCNQFWLQTFGLSKETLNQSNWHDASDPNDIDLVKKSRWVREFCL